MYLSINEILNSLISSGFFFFVRKRPTFTKIRCLITMTFIFVYRIADIIALPRSLDSAEIYISCSVHKYERHSICTYLTIIVYLGAPLAPGQSCCNSGAPSYARLLHRAGSSKINIFY